MTGFSFSLARSRFSTVGFVLIGLLIAVYGAIELSSEANQWRRRASEAEQERAQRRQLIDAAALWTSARRRAESDAQRLQGLNWRAPSEGQARAMAQDWLSQSLMARGVARPMVRIDRVTPDAPGDRRWIQVTTGGAAALPELERWLADLAASDRLVVVDRLRVQSQPAARFEAVLSLPLQVEAGQ